jgi:serine palmitoyltransferase
MSRRQRKPNGSDELEQNDRAAETTDVTPKSPNRKKKAKGTPKSEEKQEGKKEIPAEANHASEEAGDHNVQLNFFTVLLITLTYVMVLLGAYFSEYLYQVNSMVQGKTAGFAVRKGYAPLFKDFEYFWTRHAYSVIRDCYERPVASGPGRFIKVLERVGRRKNEVFDYTGRTLECINTGSYNYLGFGGPNEFTEKDVLQAIRQYGTSTCSARAEIGTTAVHIELEKKVAEFVGKPAAIIFGMGYETNSTAIPSLVGKGGLIISDSLNHASLVTGCRASGAKITVFRHNDPKSLEMVLRKAIAEGQPRTHRPWKKILVVVEGIYSMEGEVLKLKEIVAVKNKYKAYLYIDEAHSIGAIGRGGRGVCAYAGVDPKEVDILMGTFTKSFGSVGGYIASSPEIIAYLRKTAFGALYDTSMSVPAAVQSLAAMKTIMGEIHGNEGERRLRSLRDNTIYVRRRLKELGFYILGNYDSPVIPLLIGHPTKMPFTSRACLEQNLAVVVVGFPATPLATSRARICVSASHAREDLDEFLAIIEDVGTRGLLRYGQKVSPATCLNALRIKFGTFLPFLLPGPRRRTKAK